MKHYEEHGEFKGLWVRTAQALRRGGYLTRGDVREAVNTGNLRPHLSVRDYGRYAHQEVIFWLVKRRNESARLPRVAPRIWDTVRMVFTTDEAVAKWLTSPNRQLDRQTPCDLLVTKVGTAEVLSLVKAMVRGRALNGRACERAAPQTRYK